MMNSLKTWKCDQLSRRVASLCLSLLLIIGIAFSYSHAAQAAVDTTSAATRVDADRIKQRKEDTPRYPNWYEDQRSLESYMERAGVDPNEPGNSPTDQNNDAGYNPIRQDRVNGYKQARNEDSNLIERSRDRLRDTASNVRETLSSNSPSRSSYNDRTDANDIKDRAGNRIEQAKDVFQEATERAAEARNPIITGESSQ